MKKFFMLSLFMSCFLVTNNVEAQKIIPVASRIENGNEIAYIGGHCNVSDSPYFIEGGDQFMLWKENTDGRIQGIGEILTLFSPVGNLHLDIVSSCLLIKSTTKSFVGTYDGYFLAQGDKMISRLINRNNPKNVIYFVCFGALDSRPEENENIFAAQFFSSIDTLLGLLIHPLPTGGPITLDCSAGEF